MNKAQVNEDVACSRAVIIPSVWHEPAGLVALDAAANRRAITGSKVGGLPEYAKHDENALMVKPNDIGGLSNSIDRLSVDWRLAERLGIISLQMAQGKFSLIKHMDHV